MNEIKTHRHETHFSKKKNFIINYIVIKSYAKAYKDIKNITKKFLNEKRKHISI